MCKLSRTWRVKNYTVHFAKERSAKGLEDLFVISRVHYNETLIKLIFGKTTKMFVLSRYSSWLISNAQHFQIWTISVISICIWKWLSQLTNRQTKLLKTTLHINLSSLVCFAFIFSYLSVTCWNLFIISRYILHLPFWIVFVITRI